MLVELLQAVVGGAAELQFGIPHLGCLQTCLRKQVYDVLPFLLTRVKSLIMFRLMWVCG